MRGIRNKVIHDYFEIDLDVVWTTVERDLPALEKQIRALLPVAPAITNDLDLKP